MKTTAKSVLREALKGSDEHSVATMKTMIGQALQSAANHLGYCDDFGNMIINTEELLELAYTFIDMDR